MVETAVEHGMVLVGHTAEGVARRGLCCGKGRAREESTGNLKARGERLEPIQRLESMSKEGEWRRRRIRQPATKIDVRRMRQTPTLFRRVRAL